MEFLGSCHLEGNNSVERLDREVKTQSTFYLAKQKCKYTPDRGTD